MPRLQPAIIKSGAYSRTVNSDVRRPVGCRAFPHALCLSASLSLSLRSTPFSAVSLRISAIIWASRRSISASRRSISALSLLFSTRHCACSEPRGTPSLSSTVEADMSAAPLDAEDREVGLIGKDEVLASSAQAASAGASIDWLRMRIAGERFPGFRWGFHRLAANEDCWRTFPLRSKSGVLSVHY